MSKLSMNGIMRRRYSPVLPLLQARDDDQSIGLPRSLTPYFVKHQSVDEAEALFETDTIYQLQHPTTDPFDTVVLFVSSILPLSYTSELFLIHLQEEHASISYITS